LDNIINDQRIVDMKVEIGSTKDDQAVMKAGIENVGSYLHWCECAEVVGTVPSGEAKIPPAPLTMT